MAGKSQHRGGQKTYSTRRAMAREQSESMVRFSVTCHTVACRLANRMKGCVGGVDPLDKLCTPHKKTLWARGGALPKAVWVALPAHGCHLCHVLPSKSAMCCPGAPCILMSLKGCLLVT